MPQPARPGGSDSPASLGGWMHRSPPTPRSAALKSTSSWSEAWGLAAPGVVWGWRPGESASPLAGAVRAGASGLPRWPQPRLSRVPLPGGCGPRAAPPLPEPPRGAELSPSPTPHLARRSRTNSIVRSHNGHKELGNSQNGPEFQLPSPPSPREIHCL